MSWHARGVLLKEEEEAAAAAAKEKEAAAGLLVGRWVPVVSPGWVGPKEARLLVRVRRGGGAGWGTDGPRRMARTRRAAGRTEEAGRAVAARPKWLPAGRPGACLRGSSSSRIPPRPPGLLINNNNIMPFLVASWLQSMLGVGCCLERRKCQSEGERLVFQAGPRSESVSCWNRTIICCIMFIY